MSLTKIRSKQQQNEYRAKDIEDGWGERRTKFTLLVQVAVKDVTQLRGFYSYFSSFWKFGTSKSTLSSMSFSEQRVFVKAVREAKNLRVYWRWARVGIIMFFPWRTPTYLRLRQDIQSKISDKSEHSPTTLQYHLDKFRIVELYFAVEYFILLNGLKDYLLFPFVIFNFCSLFYAPVCWKVVFRKNMVMTLAKPEEKQHRQGQERKRRQLLMGLSAKIVADVVMILELTLILATMYRVLFTYRQLRARFFKKDQPAKDKKEKEKPKPKEKTEKKTTGLAAYFATNRFVNSCFFQIIYDIPVLPFLIFAIAFTPWRLYNWYQSTKRWSGDLDNQDQVRWSLVIETIKGVGDYIHLLMTLLIVFTIWRASYLFELLTRNGHLTRKREHKVGKNLAIKTCIEISFSEWIKDFMILPVALLSVALGPWRIIALYRMVRAQQTRLPTTKDYAKFQSKRSQIWGLFLTIVFQDWLTVPFVILALGTLYRAPKIFEIFSRRYPGFANPEEGNIFSHNPNHKTSIHKEIISVGVKVIMDVVATVQIGIILVSILHAPSLYRRLKTYRQLYLQKRTYLRLAREHNEELMKTYQEKKKAKPELSNLPKNPLCEIMKGLDIVSIVNSGATCKRLKKISDTDHLWKFQFEHHWQPRGQKIEMYHQGMHLGLNFKECCIKIYEVEKMQNASMLSETERDWKMGHKKIIMEEFVFSILHIPHLFALPVKLFCYINLKLGWLQKLSSWLNNYSSVRQYDYTLLGSISKDPHFYREFNLFIDGCSKVHDSFWHIQVCVIVLVMTPLAIIELGLGLVSQILEWRSAVYLARLW
eukprot:CAMPEP_0115022366 /NCGR_PEP_ID=MMETSP0216-20121206/31508_1 /TAXON_ID=223996 /ORGANISM="Protocruzia adherens, Strain Boccale" /LENGTH=815 /DNA_ID=CAMNT_0002395037 /DNA_START=1550 /DNA_END=3994 /DNA_ORIENTATION=+